jgi:ribosomal protein S27E
MAKDSITSGFLTRITARSELASSNLKHSEWVQSHTRLSGANFSFKDHEMQQQIFDDPSSRLSVRKCSQVGLSELLVRKLLTIMGVARYVRVIYTLPTRQFAMKFSKDRVDSVISESPTLSGMIKKGADSVEQKVFTNSNVLYMAGTFGDASAISIPATYVVNDELDFSNLEIIGKMSSRLRHAPVNPDGHRGYHYKFSTPTLPNYGVSEGFDQGTQNYYMVKCKCCNHVQAPSWYSDFVIPGYDDDIKELDRTIMRRLMDRGAHNEAYIKCQKCGKSLMESLLDKDRRQWVAKYPKREESSYQISPWDVPVYNTPKSILSQMLGYNRLMDFYNFVLGLDFVDADSIFLEEVFNLHNRATWWPYTDSDNSGSLIQTVIGMDVGKICHFTVGVMVGEKLHIVYAEEINHTQTKPAIEAIKSRLLFFNCNVFCLDAGPDITLVRQLLEFCGLYNIRSYAVEYVRKVGLKDYELNEETRVCKANRTNLLTDLMKDHNNGRVQYVRQESAKIMPTFKEQVTNMKKIVREQPDGEMLEQFVKTGPDHFGHSLNYCRIASLIHDGPSSTVVGALPMVTGVKMRSGSSGERDDFKDPFAAYRPKPRR